MMRLIEDFIPEGLPCDTKKDFDGGRPSVITIHWTGPYPGQSTADVRKWWVDSGGEASAHYIVKGDEVRQCWPFSKTAWHAGCRAGNETSIGIEVIPEDTCGKFSDETVATLKELLDSLPPLPLCRHYDWTGKPCPQYYVYSDRWQDLLERLGRPGGTV